MQITILGSGTSISRLERAGSGIFLEFPTSRVLLDCGRQISFQFVRAAINPARVDHILITHPHADHISDLVPLLQSIYVRGHFSDDFSRREPITLHGYPGFAKDYADLKRIMFPEKEDFEIRIVEHGDDRQTFGDLTIITRIIPHTSFFQAISCRIEGDGKSIMYSGDSAYSEALIELARNADLAILESSIAPDVFEREGPKPNHLSPQEVGKIAQEARVRRLLLNHLYAVDTEELDEYLLAARKYFQGEILLGTDFMSIKL